MEIDEAIDIIALEIIRPDKFEKSCEILLKEVKKTAVPVNVERREFMGTFGYGIVYNREKRTIGVDPIVLAHNLRDQHRDTRIPYKQLIWFDVEHEKGHYELQESGLEPTLPVDVMYMTMYARFEDYAISRFLRNDRYHHIEKMVNRSEMKREAPLTFNNVCVSALRVALGHIKLGEIEANDLILANIKLISSKMNEVTKPTDIPELVQKLFSEIESQDWGKILS